MLKNGLFATMTMDVASGTASPVFHGRLGVVTGHLAIALEPDASHIHTHGTITISMYI